MFSHFYITITQIILPAFCRVSLWLPMQFYLKLHIFYFSFSHMCVLFCLIASSHNQFFIVIFPYIKVLHKVAHNIKHLSCPQSLGQPGSAHGLSWRVLRCQGKVLKTREQAQERKPKLKHILSLLCHQFTKYGIPLAKASFKEEHYPESKCHTLTHIWLFTPPWTAALQYKGKRKWIMIMSKNLICNSYVCFIFFF